MNSKKWQERKNIILGTAIIIQLGMFINDFMTKKRVKEGLIWFWELNIHT